LRSSKKPQICRRLAASGSPSRTPATRTIELREKARSIPALGWPVANPRPPPASKYLFSSIAAVGPTGADEEKP
jgi:hypothetical protein